MIGEAELVSIGAAAAGLPAADLLAATDMAALARVAADAEIDGGTLEYAARLLLAVVREHPFPGAANPAAAWLTAAYVLDGAGVRWRGGRGDVVDLVRGLDPTSELRDVMVALDRVLARRGPRLAWLCPSCGREVYAQQRRERRPIHVGVTPYELRARCWYEHRAHDRQGRPFPAVVDTEPIGAW